MFNFKFGEIEIVSKDFHKQRQINDIVTINVNKVVVSDKVSCNKNQDWWYIVDYQVDVKRVIPLFTKTLKDIFSYGVSQYCNNPLIQRHLKFLRSRRVPPQYRNI